MGEQEITSLMEKEGQVGVNCDFCNRRYMYDCVDITALFSQSPRLAAPGTPQ
jgi:molecular chaperone Hsp33